MHLDLNRAIVAVVAAVAVCFASTGAQAETILTFEGQVSPGGYYDLMSSYGGLTWVNMNALNYSPTLDGTTGGYIAGAVSGTTTAIGNDGDVTSATPFTFNSAYFTGAFNDGLNVTVEGWNSGSLLYTTSFTVDASAPTFRTFDYAGIDDLRITSFGGTLSPSVTYGGFGDNVVIDNFAFTSGSSPVPEPSTFVLAVTGVLSLGIWRRYSRLRSAAKSA